MDPFFSEVNIFINTLNVNVLGTHQSGNVTFWSACDGGVKIGVGAKGIEIHV